MLGGAGGWRRGWRRKISAKDMPPHIFGVGTDLRATYGVCRVSEHFAGQSERRRQRQRHGEGKGRGKGKGTGSDTGKGKGIGKGLDWDGSWMDPSSASTYIYHISHQR